MIVKKYKKYKVIVRLIQYHAHNIVFTVKIRLFLYKIVINY